MLEDQSQQSDPVAPPSRASAVNTKAPRGQICSLWTRTKINTDHFLSQISQTQHSPTRRRGSTGLQENYEEKKEDLMNQIREAEEKLSAEQEDSVEEERKTDEGLNLLILQDIELQRLALKTNEYREKVKKEKKKQEKKEQQERERERRRRRGKK
ncbi:unnamed protein product [Pleuronectes platessa]|uniref:Uncharacterized protein n=1 Tax=Pleuronectes platessa TaxID=8262 RepID=A0A9N7YDH5_PLEPL|nr:unnamed protein product [Pleuronectes platessa]